MQFSSRLSLRMGFLRDLSATRSRHSPTLLFIIASSTVPCRQDKKAVVPEIPSDSLVKN